jgi:hypothetical protein
VATQVHGFNLLNGRPKGVGVGGVRLPMHYYCLLFLLRPQIRDGFALESLPKKLKNDIANEPGCRGNFEIGKSENIFDCPHYAPLHSHT